MKYNLIFEGLNETEGENTETVIKEFIKTELKIENEISFVLSCSCILFFIL
jgi:hypothetical protein